MPTLHGRFVTFSKFCCNWLVAVHKTRSERILLCTVVTTLCEFEGLLVVYLLLDSFWLILIVFLGQISSIKHYMISKVSTDMRFTVWQKNVFTAKIQLRSYNLIWYGFNRALKQFLFTLQRLSRFKSTYNQYLIFIEMLLNQILIYSYHIHKNLKPGTKHI